MTKAQMSATSATILQIAPEIGTGTGVGEVARALEAEWRKSGIQTLRFTMKEAGGDWIPRGRPGVLGKLDLMARVLWFSTVGTVRAQAVLRHRPDLLSVCHNDALAGDLYVNHGVIQAAMRSRGAYVWRMARNPMHLFVASRDRMRYGGRWHRTVVNLSSTEERLLRSTYRPFKPRTVVIGNGVDLDRFQPATSGQREAARRRFGLDPQARTVLFVGHEFGRKGLVPLMQAIARCATPHVLLVVGGTKDAIHAAKRQAVTIGVDDRVVFAGRLRDTNEAFHAADVFCLPSAYEAFPLVFLEALASGVPVVAPPVGAIPDIVVERETGITAASDADSIAAALTSLAQIDPALLALRSRQVAEEHSWSQIANRYAEVLREARPLASRSAPA